MPEWLKGAVSKTVEPVAGSVGSNPTLSAIETEDWKLETSEKQAIAGCTLWEKS